MIMKKLGLLFVFVLVIGFSYAAEDWGSINNENNIDGQNISGSGNNINNDSGVENSIISFNNKTHNSSPFNTKYTINFYIASGLGIFGVLIVALFIYLFVRGPRNKW